MASPRDYYEVIGVDRGATPDQIRKAYRKLARQYHPDMNKSPDASKRFQEIQEAYDVLSDEQKRSAYDRFGHAGVGAGQGPAGGPGGAGWGGFHAGPGPGRRGSRAVWTNVGDVDEMDLGSIFEQMFSGAGGGQAAQTPFGASRQRVQPRRGADVEHPLSVTFLTAALGGTEELRLGSDGGAQTIQVRIPPGTEDGAKLRLKGKGRPGPTGHRGDAAGDLILVIRIGRHPYFRREGLDLFIDVPVNIAEAALGVTVTVPLLPQRPEATTGDGSKRVRSVDVKVPPGASSGQKLRVRGRGITDARGTTGDLYVVIQIVAPDSLSENGRNLLTKLAAELKNPRESAPWADDVRA